FFQSRYDCEQDESILQPIPYIIAFGEGDTVFAYVRAENIQDYGDERLFGKYSIGLGGHVKMTSNGPETIERCIYREVFEEEVEFTGKYTKPLLAGTLFCRDKSVDRVHFGFIYAMKAEGINEKEASVKPLGFLPINDIKNDPKMPHKYETWSRVLIPHISEIKSILEL
ncbi:MAG: hypothetical protein JW924_14590, partial [Fusobacteriaceae bacterium]|nr:hypothetical protein [Fusobacteriaceae bacterium]